MNQFRVYCPKMKEKSLPTSSARPQKVPKSRTQPSPSPPHTRCKYTERPAQYNFKQSGPAAPQTNYTKTSQSERNCLYQFHKGIAWEPFLFRPNYKVSFELQNKMVWKPVFKSKTNKHAKIKCSGLLPEGCCQQRQKWPLSPSLGCPGKLHTSPGRQFPNFSQLLLQSNQVINK